MHHLNRRGFESRADGTQAIPELELELEPVRPPVKQAQLPREDDESSGSAEAATHAIYWFDLVE